MKKLTTLLLTTTLALAACSKSNSNRPPDKTPSVEIENPLADRGITVSTKRAVELNADASNIDEVKAELNHYQVTLQIPTSLASNISIERENAQKEGREPVDLILQQVEGSFVFINDTINLDKAFLTKNKFRYFIHIKSEDLEPIEISLKPDLLIDGKIHSTALPYVSDDFEIATLIITKDSSFITDGRKLSIQADAIISEGGMIESFTADERLLPAREGSPGTGGGDLIINTDYLTGDLKIFMRGKKGGKGVDGQVVKDRPPKANRGADYIDSDQCRMINDSGNCDYWECTVYGSDGPTGAKGNRGNDGASGSRGGDSGAFTLNAKQATKYQVLYEAIPGDGGEPGHHSEGGQGGDGGDPGLIRTRNCGEGSPGQEGPRGDSGLDGKPGLPGNQMKSTITINGLPETGGN